MFQCIIVVADIVVVICLFFLSLSLLFPMIANDIIEYVYCIYASERMKNSKKFCLSISCRRSNFVVFELLKLFGSVEFFVLIDISIRCACNNLL